MNYRELNKWGKGTKQIEAKKARQEEEKRLIDEPMTRYEIDKDVDNNMKQKDRFGDPMKKLINHSKLAKLNKERNAEEEEEEEYSEGGRVKIKKKDKSKDGLKDKEKEYKFNLKCKFKGLPNRLNIDPGYVLLN